jgi:SUKH-4 immunity protein/Xanthomonas XOO_2897-like deaminase
MVTFAQAQERAEHWINTDVPGYETREIRVREFDLGFVVWSEAREDGPSSDEGSVRVVISRDSGDATLWPALPIGELIRRYEEEYGAVQDDAVPEPPQRLDLEATSFLLSPPQWLQDAADRMGIPDRRSAVSGESPSGAPAPAADSAAAGVGRIDYRRPGGSGPDHSGGAGGAQAPAAARESSHAPSSSGGPGAFDAQGPSSSSGAPNPSSGGIDYRRPGSTSTPGTGGPEEQRPAATPAGAPNPSGAPRSPGGVDYRRPGAESVPARGEGGGNWAGKTVSDSGEGQSVAVPATVFAPPISGAGRGEQPSAAAEARTELLAGGSSLPRTSPAPRQDRPPAAPPNPGAPHTIGGSAFPPPGGPSVALPPPVETGGAGVADLDAARSARGSVPPPGPGTPPPPYAGAPTPGPGTPPPPAAGNPHYAATMLAGPAGPPPPMGAGTPPPPPPGVGAPPPPPGTGTPPPPGAGNPHYAATMLAGPAGPPPPMGASTPPPPPGAGAPGMAPPPPPAYGYPQGGSVPTVGPGYMAVLRYRGQDGSEQQLIRRSAPGTPHPEWQILHELRSLGVRPEQVLELHTELESCDLPGGYCTRMIRETWPQVRISHTAPYGRDHASRQQGVQHLLTHQGELHQVAGAPARPHPQRVPMPDPHTVPRVPPVGLDVIGQELAGAFGPQGVFRFDQRAVSRQGVPDIVAQTLVWSGLPVDFGPFFWAQAQPGQPVPTLAELATQRGVRPSSDAGSYLVMGNDFGRQLCVQYGTAHIVAVPMEAGPDGQPVPPQFVNSSLPEFARSLALLGRMWRLRIGLTPEQAGHWTVDFQAQLAAQDPAAIASPDNWWSVLIEQMWDGLL